MGGDESLSVFSGSSGFVYLGRRLIEGRDLNSNFIPTEDSLVALAWTFSDVVPNNEKG